MHKIDVSHDVLYENLRFHLHIYNKSTSCLLDTRQFQEIDKNEIDE